MKTLKRFLLVAAAIYIPMHSVAWGTQGHRICGQIAAAYLTPKTRKAIEAILGNESIALAGNWADNIKSDPDYAYLSPWHYVNFDRPYTYVQMAGYLAHDNDADAYTRLQFLIGELKKKGMSNNTKQLYLRMVIHIVEDIHQPMHTGRADDKGGNDIKLSWFDEPTNLHAVWDSKLIDFQQLSYTEYAAAINHCSLAQRSEWQKAPISRWIFESNQIAEKLYADTRPNDRLGYKYNYQYIDTLNKQLLKAGVRLAGVLNNIFG